MDQDDIAQLRALPLERVLEALGAQRDPKDPTRNWRLGGSRITVTESQFYDHNAAGALHRMHKGHAGGGGAIDLMQYAKDLSFREAIRDLRELAPTIRVSEEPRRSLGRQRAPRDPRPSPKPAADRAERARWYLTAVRLIPNPIVDHEMHSGQVFADARGNVVFRLRSATGQEVGYEVRGTLGTPYHSVHGEKGLFITKAGPDRTAVFVESAIEALSYRALRGGGLIVSTTGSAIEQPALLGQRLQERGYQIVAAFNADKSGDWMAEKFREVLGDSVKRERPAEGHGKDWNEELQFRRGVAPSPHTHEKATHDMPVR